MLARPPFHRAGWVVEEKVDGWRLLAYKEGSRVRLISRTAVDHTSRFRELAAAVAKLRPEVLVLDGEVAVFDEQLVSRFGLLGDPDPPVLCTPPMFMTFDVLQVGREDVRALPLGRRRTILEEAVAGSPMVLPVRRLEPDGRAAWETVERRGLEGFVAKDPASTYRSGPTRSWTKVKLRREGVFVVGGLRDVDAFDGVLVGEWVGEALHYRGVVEWGFRAPDVLELLRAARSSHQRFSSFADLPSFRNARWLEPRLHAEVSYAEIASGRYGRRCGGGSWTRRTRGRRSGARGRGGDTERRARRWCPLSAVLHTTRSNGGPSAPVSRGAGQVKNGGIDTPRASSGARRWPFGSGQCVPRGDLRRSPGSFVRAEASVREERRPVEGRPPA